MISRYFYKVALLIVLLSNGSVLVGQNFSGGITFSPAVIDLSPSVRQLLSSDDDFFQYSIDARPAVMRGITLGYDLSSRWLGELSVEQRIQKKNFNYQYVSPRIEGDAVEILTELSSSISQLGIGLNLTYSFKSWTIALGASRWRSTRIFPKAASPFQVGTLEPIFSFDSMRVNNVNSLIVTEFESASKVFDKTSISLGSGYYCGSGIYLGLRCSYWLSSPTITRVSYYRKDIADAELQSSSPSNIKSKVALQVSDFNLGLQLTYRFVLRKPPEIAVK